MGPTPSQVTVNRGLAPPITSRHLLNALGIGARLPPQLVHGVADVVLVVQARLIGVKRVYEEAAMSLGANRFQTFREITLPLIMPAIVSGWMLAFTLSWDDVVISQFVSGPGSSTLPMEIFSRVRRGVSPDINALATIMVLIVATGVVASTIWMKRQERQRALEEQMARSDTP